MQPQQPGNVSAPTTAETGQSPAQFAGSSFGAQLTIPEHHDATSASYGSPFANLASIGPSAVDVGQQMIDQVVGECIAHEEWHEPEVESDIHLGPAGVDPTLFHIGTPTGSAPVPMEHELVLPLSTLKQRESPRTPEEEPEATRLEAAH